MSDKLTRVAIVSDDKVSGGVRLFYYTHNGFLS